MKTIYPLIFQTKINSIQKITKGNRDRYEEILSKIIGSEIEFKNIPLYNEFHFLLKIPIENDLLPEQNVFFRDFLSENIFKSNFFIADKCFKSHDDVFFFDLSSIGRQGLILSLLMQLIPFLDKNLDKNRVVILIDDLPSTFDFSFVFCKDFISENQLVVFDKYGRFANSELEKKIDIVKIRNLLIDLTPPIEELIRNKMVSKIGHYRRTDKKGMDICFRTYFDGQFCVEEISKYLSTYIQTKIQQKPLIIVYYASNSSWLKDIVYIVVNKLITNNAIYIEINDLKETTINKYFKNFSHDFEILFVTDLLNTGETFKFHYLRIANALPQNNSIKINCISILNNKLRNAETNKNKRKFVVLGKSIFVEYILDVEVIQKHVNSCELCKLGLPNSNFDEDYKLKLTSFEFWELYNTSENMSEAFVPFRKNRDKIHFYPNILSWLEKNGPYIAYKFKKNLDANSISINDLILVLPDESKEGKNGAFIDTPSGRFVNCLELIHGIEYITIPRDILDYYYNHEIDESIYIQKKLWLRQLSESTSNLLIVDESHVKGGTYFAMRKILSFLNKSVVGYFPIIDFNPILTQKNMKTSPELCYLNLYEFQML